MHFCRGKKAAAVIAALSISTGIVTAQAPLRHAASPGYKGRDVLCPQKCLVSGSAPSNWSVYHNLDQLEQCEKTIFYSFSLYDEVDDPTTHHRIFACSAYGDDWYPRSLPQKQNTHNNTSVHAIVDFEIGWETYSTGNEVGYGSLIRQMSQYLAAEADFSDSNTMIFAQDGSTTAGLYVGRSFKRDFHLQTAMDALKMDSDQSEGQRNAVVLQLCEPSYDSDHVFGFYASSNGTFEAVQEALKSWSQAKCLNFGRVRNVTGEVIFTAPLLSSITSNGTIHTNTMYNDSMSMLNYTSSLFKYSLKPRGECRTEKVVAGDSCASLAQSVRCSAGQFPDFRPKPNDDGSCATMIVGDGESCSSIAATNSLTIEDIENFNQKTWAWNGCTNIWKGSVICTSSGSPPMPAPMVNAVCGPQVPGTVPPKDGTKLAALNPCPLNACCDVWGQCGTTSDFCTDTGTGAPGTAKPGTNGCISNCGTSIVRGSYPSTFRQIGYFEGFMSNRKCLYQSPSQIDTAKYTHLHFAFGDISLNYEISINGKQKRYQFDEFLSIQGPKKILSFGGWDFSTNPATYQIFRQGTTPEKRLQLASNIADFVKENDLDGVDIDWEYLAASDIPGIPPGNEEEGMNYLTFLVVLRNLLHDKSLSIAAPASYWYLKGFPIKKISQVVDYIVYMTYDLHGQWDAGNAHSQITKAGVASGKVVTGITSYGRSFHMADPDCSSPNCQFTGSRLSSDAEKGPCTDTAGYIADAEIATILASPSRVNQHYLDRESDSYILSYDDTEWVAYMNDDIRFRRTITYQALSMGGTVNWATDLEDYNGPFVPHKGWGQIHKEIDSGINPRIGKVGQHGNWSEIPCTDPWWLNRDRPTKERWAYLDANDAWADMTESWKKAKEAGTLASSSTFSTFMSSIANANPHAECGDVNENNCEEVSQCIDAERGKYTGPARAMVWNSLVQISNTYNNFQRTLVLLAATKIQGSLDLMEDIFAPVPPDVSQWLDVLLGVVSLAAPMISGKFFENVIAKIPIEIASDEAKKMTTTLTSGIVSVASTFKEQDAKSWTTESQDTFSAYIGDSVYGWANAVEQGLSDLFDGSDESIEKLTTLITDGKFLEQSEPDKNDDGQLADDILLSIYTFAIPALWQASGHSPFIIDTGKGCNEKDNSFIGKDLKSTCYDGTVYKLADPDGPSSCCQGCVCGDAGLFSSPPGVKSLNGDDWGGLEAKSIIEGAVKTWLNNDKENVAENADPTDSTFINGLIDGDLTTAGYVRLPVCDSNTAYKSWKVADGNSDQRHKENFPCIPTGYGSYCGKTTYEDQTTDASPPLKDCKKLIEKAEKKKEKHTLRVNVQNKVLKYGKCIFGAHAPDSGPALYHIGNQDIINIVTESIKRYERDGRVGSKGDFSCNAVGGTSHVKWVLY